MFLLHLLEGRREQVVVPAAAAAVAAEKEDVLNVVVVVISSLSLNSNEYNKYNIKREMRDEIFVQHSSLREGKRKRFKTDEEDSRWILSKKLLLFLSVCHLFFFFAC